MAFSTRARKRKEIEEEEFIQSPVKSAVKLPLALPFRDDSELLANGCRLLTFLENYGHDLADLIGVPFEVDTFIPFFLRLKYI